MNKKITAVFCIAILMVSIFTACGKKDLYMQNINGVKQPVVTNENGEVVTNADGEVAVYVTDAKGENITAENGEPNVNYIKPPQVLVHPNNTVTVNNFTIKVPDGWEAAENGRVCKKNTDMKCYIQAIYETTATEENSFESYIDTTLLQNRQLIDAINNGAEETKNAGYYSAEYTSDEFTFQDYQGRRLSYVIYGDKGQVVHYAENLYFIIPGGTIYSIDYACEGGVGYDKEFNFREWVESNVSFKAPTKSK
ncbi:MAG: hypothetical protein K2G60_04305 [Oscillospiraceae bacterium]|nr:hypothetical protein [Oscillospiraceae bacterium]